MTKRILIFILILAAVLRITGVYPGYHPNHADEVNIFSQAVNILKTGSVQEIRFEYPPLPAYINFLSFKFIFIPLSWIKYYANNLGQIIDGTFLPNLQNNILGNGDINAMFWARTVTAIFGVGIVFLIYKISEKLFNKNVGLVAAFLVTVNYRQVLNSHFGLPDIYNAFFLCLSFFLTIRVWKKPDFKNYLIAAIGCGLAFSTKYQFFSFLPLFIIHIFRVLEQKDLKRKLKTLFDPSAISVPFVILFVFLILNPYFIIQFDIAKTQLEYAALKYRYGKDFLDFYPISYLYKYGIGQITSILVLIGTFFLFTKSNFRKGILLFSVILEFAIYLLYVTGGGFYTRNFVSITPLILIIPAVFLERLLNYKKYFGIIIFSLLVVFAGYENLNKDYVLDVNYLKPWNQDVLQTWITYHLPSNAKIAAHSSVPLENSQTRLDFDLDSAFDIYEFKNEGADFAIANYEWTTNDFYWWMTQNTQKSLKYWNAPTQILNETFTGMAMHEIEDFGIYSLIKPAFAPDANFLVAKLPDYKVTNKILIRNFDFKSGENGWTKIGNNLSYTNGNLVIQKGGIADPYVRWISPKINISNQNGFEIDYKIKTADDIGQKREGFLFVEFFNDKNDEIGVRLSSRNDVFNKYTDAGFVGEIPSGASYAKIGFQVYKAENANVYLSDVKIYKADVINLNSSGVKHIDIPDDIFYPISQGNM
ncbi:MAG TPA: glycosyltransferase family 39 protein [Patescibacteria group bacterium]|nr:glycosyltransferase family 39 protein [Patescibacteria group bacterium]